MIEPKSQIWMLVFEKSQKIQKIKNMTIPRAITIFNLKTFGVAANAGELFNTLFHWNHNIWFEAVILWKKVKHAPNILS